MRKSRRFVVGTAMRIEKSALGTFRTYLQAAGREDEALEQLKKVLELDPNQVVALASMVMIQANKGEIAQALKFARRAYAVGRWFPDTVGLLATPAA